MKLTARQLRALKVFEFQACQGRSLKQVARQQSFSSQRAACELINAQLVWLTTVGNEAQRSSTSP